MENSSHSFDRDGVAVIPSLLDERVRKLTLHQLTLMGVNGDLIGNADISNEQVIYSPYPLEALMLHLLPLVEAVVGRPLLPSFSFLWVFKKGGKLVRHKDRESVDIAATANLAASEVRQWPLKVEMPQEVRDINTSEGDVAILDGKRHFHWREPCEIDWRLQAQFLYVFADGPNADACLDYRETLASYPVERVITTPVQQIRMDVDTGLPSRYYLRSAGGQHEADANRG